jgi:uncharacterized protein (DUF488 family)
MSSTSEPSVYTVGHSTRTLAEFTTTLKTYHVNFLVDIRSVPRSRYNPKFNKETLSQELKFNGIKYLHIPELGGLRRPHSDSVNLALQNKSFRGYADYMQTKEFAEHLLRLVALASEKRLAIMCSEAAPWRCHRILLSDALVARHMEVNHILTEASCLNHKLTPFAHIEGTNVTYPLFTKEKTQRALTDFS